ncbi:hypothetical protein SCAR479_05788 [Seiridium cardinale]|uniref:Uncharacterized protein n=1 Tax=Seiridium cardinale TaxID=138064 RepID=A0ABR2XUM2_9PEZI
MGPSSNKSSKPDVVIVDERRYYPSHDSHCSTSSTSTTSTTSTRHTQGHSSSRSSSSSSHGQPQTKVYRSSKAADYMASSTSRGKTVVHNTNARGYNPRDPHPSYDGAYQHRY